MTSIDYSKKSLVVVTGASKGIGRAISLEISRKLEQTSIIILMARSEDGLNETKALIHEIDKTLTVQTYCVDFSKVSIDLYKNIFKQVLSTVDKSDISNGVIFHNAGQLGTFKKTTDLINISDWREHFDINLFSVALLNSTFIENIKPISKNLFVVNISSLLGREPMVNGAMYGTGKAARELFFKVLSVEEPDITVLNYSPGPVETDMFNSIIEIAQSETVRNQFKVMKETTVLSPTVTVNKLLDIMDSGTFKSGETVDYYGR